MPTAADTLLEKARALLDAGDYPTLDTALAAVSKAHPALYVRYMKEATPRTGVPGVIGERGAPPRPSHPPAHPEELDTLHNAPNYAPRATAAHEALKQLCDEERERHPELDEGELLKRAMASPRGQELQVRHRLEHFARARGKP